MVEQDGSFIEIQVEQVELVERKRFFEENQEEEDELTDEDRKAYYKDEIRQLLERIKSAEKSVNKFQVFNGNLVLPSRFTLLPTYEVLR